MRPRIGRNGSGGRATDVARKAWVRSRRARSSNARSFRPPSVITSRDSRYPPIVGRFDALPEAVEGVSDASVVVNAGEVVRAFVV